MCVCLTLSLSLSATNTEVAIFNPSSPPAGRGVDLFWWPAMSTKRRLMGSMELFVAAVLLLQILLLAAVGGAGAGRDGLLSVFMVDHAHQDIIGASLMDVLENKLSSQEDVPPDFFCHSCQEVSKKVEKFLADPSLYDGVDTLSSEICHILHPDLQVKCRKVLELYLREGILFLQILFLEKNICSSTGFCPINNNISSTSSLIPTSDDHHSTTGVHIKSSPFEGREWKKCETCHVATEQIRRGLENHEQQINVIKTLLDACELVQTHADKCKRLVFQYGPLGLANLQKFLSSTDFCHLIHLCEEAKPPKGKTIWDD